MSSNPREVRATVKVTLSVLARSIWGPETTIAQVENQAMSEVEDQLNTLFGSHPNIKMLDKSEVVVMYVEKAGSSLL